MFSEVLIALYAGSLFAITFLVAPTLLRVDKNKDIAGSLYGRVLWRFYRVALFMLLLYFILGDAKFYAILLMLGLGLNVGISYWLKNYKRRLGNIDLVDYKDPRRVLFRRMSILSTFILLMNFLLSMYVLIKHLKGGSLAGV